jgi:hypothetical protein
LRLTLNEERCSLLQRHRFFSSGSPVAFEKTRRSEFAELVADHVFSHEDGDKLSPVVNSECVADHLRGNRGSPRPGLDDFSIFILIHLLDFLEQVIIHEGALAD